MIDFTSALVRAKENSGFLALQIELQPELAALLAAGNIQGALAFADYAGENAADDMAARLRKKRNALALSVAIADLAGAWDLTRVTHTLSDFADEALERAIEAVIRERYDCDPRGFTVIGLGKHGGRELNYSSDIDPIFLFDPDTIPMRAREEPQEAAVRIGRRVMEMLSARDGNGYVFRVDMRLRPSPEVTPIAISVHAAISYYESAALAWEQAAFIRSRVVAGDRALGEDFLAAIQPFIWRKSLDFGQIDNIGRMSVAIRDHYHKGQTFGPGFDLKRGRGGIRECEFFAQVHQLIHGGRHPGLRVADTRTALKLLADAGIIEQEISAQLIESYTLHRTIEHRLQMMADRQTHELPKGAAELDAAARLHGLKNGDALIDLLRPNVDRVGKIYDELTRAQEGGMQIVPDGGLPLEERLKNMGYHDLEPPLRFISLWRSGRYRALRSAAAKTAFEQILPDILSALAHSPDPERAILRFDALLEKLPTAINFFHLLGARPGLLDMIGRLLAHAPVLADALARRAELLDGLIDARALDLPGSVADIAAELKGDENDYERLLDRVRSRVNEHRFALGVQLIEGAHDPLDIAEAFARVAEAAIAVLVSAAHTEFAAVHGHVPDSDLAILALGRLGGGALTYASDLDVVFVFSGEMSLQSVGARPKSITAYYNILAQRIVAALSVATAAGPLYEVDTRLRPSGTQGLLAVSLDGFARYQNEDAWTWEHMALCRARPVYGSPAARLALQEIVLTTLLKSRDTSVLQVEVLKMRAKIEQSKPAGGEMDAKLLSGGLVDIEFLTHYLQLKTGIGLFPGVEKAISALANEGHLDIAFGEAHLFMTRLLVIVRFVSPALDAPPLPTRHLVAARMGFDDWQKLMDAFAAHRALVIGEWTRHLGARNFKKENNA